jgi:hypothetical protein
MQTINDATDFSDPHPHHQRGDYEDSLCNPGGQILQTMSTSSKVQINKPLPRATGMPAASMKSVASARGSAILATLCQQL